MSFSFGVIQHVNLKEQDTQPCNVNTDSLVVLRYDKMAIQHLTSWIWAQPLIVPNDNNPLLPSDPI